jgi:DNA-binding CsgD family transcriptional regulator
VKLRELACAQVLARGDDQREIFGAIRQPCETTTRADAPTYSPRATAPVAAALGTQDYDLAAVYDLPVPSQARLRSLFDLTIAEARIAQRLACGDSVEEAAQKLNIKMTTARTQLAAIFAKTDTRRQAKLVAILSRVAHLG